MHRRIFGTACVVALFGLTAFVAAPALAAQATTTAVAAGSLAAGEVKPPVAVPTDEFAPTAELVSVHFDFARSEIRPGDTATLDKNADWLKANPKNAVLLEGAADQRGTRAYNQALADRRAQAVKGYLVARGVAPDRIMTISYGEGRLACPTNADPCWSDSRRVDFQVKALNKQAP